jgi:hypothetical protein
VDGYVDKNGGSFPGVWRRMPSFAAHVLPMFRYVASLLAGTVPVSAIANFFCACVCLHCCAAPLPEAASTGASSA